MNYAALLQSALVALLRNKMRSILTVLGITIGIAAVICVVAIGKAGQVRVEQHLNNLGDNFIWIEAGGRAVNGVRTGTHDTPPRSGRLRRPPRSFHQSGMAGADAGRFFKCCSLDRRWLAIRQHCPGEFWSPVYGYDFR